MGQGGKPLQLDYNYIRKCMVEERQLFCFASFSGPAQLSIAGSTVK